MRQKSYKDSVYIKDLKFDPKNPISPGETSCERRTRKKFEKKTKLLLSLYLYLKGDEELLVINKCQLIYTEGILKEIQKLKDEWTLFVKVSYNHKSKVNADPDFIQKYIDNDIIMSKNNHWMKVFYETMDKYNLKFKQEYTKWMKPENLVENVIYDIVCDQKPCEHYIIWGDTVKYPRLIYVLQWIIKLFH